MASALKFIAFTALSLGFTGTLSPAATGSKAEKGPIPPDLLFVPAAIPAEENAIMNWHRAAQSWVRLSENGKQAIRYAWTPGEKRASSEELGELRAWLEHNHAALDMFDASLRKSKAQWPARNPQDEQPELSAFAELMRGRILEADELAEHHEFEKAGDSLQGSLRLAQTGIEADAALIHYLVAGATRTLVHGGMLRLASRAETPLPVLERLLKNLPKLDSETNTYSHILRVGFTMYDYPSIDLKKMAEQWSRVSETNIAMLYFPEQFRRPFKVILDPSLVSLHPKPLDEVGELERSVRFYRICRTNSVSSWTNRTDAAEEERNEIRQKLLEDIEPLMKSVEGEPFPLSKLAAQKARAAYLQIENPIGRISRCSDSSLSSTDIRIFRFRTEREVTRAILGSLIFERRKGQLPRSLDQLVDEHILDSVPMDYFSDKPLCYSRERGLIWSVGEDGVENGGTGNAKVHWVGDDAVWEIPKIK